MPALYTLKTDLPLALIVFLEQVRLGVTHDVFAGGLMGELGEQPLGDFEALAQAGVDILAAHLRRDAAVDLERSTATVQLVGKRSNEPGEALF